MGENQLHGPQWVLRCNRDLAGLPRKGTGSQEGGMIEVMQTLCTSIRFGRKEWERGRHENVGFPLLTTVRM